MAVYQISASVDAQNIKIDMGDVQLVSGSSDIYQVSFDFTDEWASYTKKVVFYTEWKKSIIELLLSGTNIITIPTRSLAYSGFLRIGVYGTGTNDEKLPTVWSQKIGIYEGTCQGYENPPAPDPDVYEEILSAMAGKQDILTFDNLPTEDSDNPVKSGGIYDALTEKADTDGTYPELVAGTADQLVSDNVTVNKVPYNFRATPTNTARVRGSVVGGLVVWNQLASLTASDWSLLRVTMSAVNHKITITSTASGSSFKTAFLDLPTNHKYLISGVYKGADSTAGGSIGMFDPSASNSYNKRITFTKADIGTDDFPFADIFESTSTYYRIRFGMGTAAVTGDTFTIDNLVIHDLTAMFPPAIVDYVWILEQNTAGSGIAWLKAHGFFLKDYYAHDKGSLQSVNVSAHKMVGFNQWDEEWESGDINIVNGQKRSQSGRIRSKNFIPVLPNTTYYACYTNPSAYDNSVMCFYDANKGWVSSQSGVGYKGAKNQTFTTPSWCHYIMFYCTASTYNNDICINLSDPQKDGQYESYVEHTYSLDNTLTLRGIPKLDANNELYFDGDVYTADGSVARKFAISTFVGDEAWEYVSSWTDPAFRLSGNNFLAICPNAKAGGMTFLTDTKYMDVGQKSAWQLISAVGNNVIGVIGSAAGVVIRDDSYSDATTFKATLAGRSIIYELATPTEEDAAPYDDLQYVGSTESYTDYAYTQGTRDFELPVGHDSEYIEDSVKKLSGLPWNFANLIAPTEASYTATRNYTTGALLIVNNILYKATANIANGGAITPNTNVTATTLAEVISAL